jgi:translocation and assembly module TamB
VAQLRKPLAGMARVTGQGAGTTDARVMNVQATLDSVRYGGVRLERVTANAEYANRRALVNLNLSRDGRSAVVAQGSLPVALSYFGMELLPDSLRASIRTDNASFELIEALAPAFRDARGLLVANLDIAGTWDHPDVAGGLRVQDGEVWVDSLGIKLNGIDVDIALFGHADSLAVRRATAWSGAGPGNTISLGGYVRYRDLDNPYVNLALTARAFHALDRRALARLDISTEPGGLTLQGRLRGATLSGGLVVDRGTVFLPDPELARKQVDYVSSTDSVSATAGIRLLESVIIDGVSVRLGDEVWLRSREANIKLGGTLNVERRQRRGLALAFGAIAEVDSTFMPTLDGVLRAERGTYTLPLGLVQREFTVEQGTITFFGATGLAPEMNISALHTVRTVNKDDIRIRVRLTGTIDNPVIALESAESFALSASDIVSYLIFGQQSFELGSERGQNLQLAMQTLLPSAQTYFAAQLRSWVGSAADFIQLRPGTADAGRIASGEYDVAFQDFFWTSRLGGEKQISDNLWVSLSTGLCPFRPGEETGTFQELFVQGLSGRLEYRLSRDASIRAGKEPSASACRPVVGRVIESPSQWGLSLFKTWRF